MSYKTQNSRSNSKPSPPSFFSLTCINTPGPYTCGEYTTRLATGTRTGASRAEHSPPPHQHGSGHWVGRALPAVPSTNSSQCGERRSVETQRA